MFTVITIIYNKKTKGKYVDCSRPTSPQVIQYTHIHTICCRITETYHKVINLLTYNFIKEQCMLPEDDLTIEICRSFLNVLV